MAGQPTSTATALSGDAGPNLSHKVIAACSGAVMTSLTMTPFDVVKTRLQAQPTPEPLFVPSRRLPPPIPSQPSSSQASTSKAAASVASTTTTGSSCCQKTYFTANVSESNLLCKFDPRTTTSILPSMGTHHPSTSSTSASHHIDLARRALSMSSVLPLRPSHPNPTQLISSATCIFPDLTSARALLPSLATITNLTGSSTPLTPAQIASIPQRHMNGMFDALYKIVRYEGVGSLWRGVGPALTIAIPSQAGYMVGYDLLRRTALTYVPVSSSTGDRIKSIEASVPLICGAVSRAIIVSIFSPVELLRTRLQYVPNAQSTSSMAVTRSLLESVRKEGWISLWRGLPATLWRDVPFSAIYWASYEMMKSRLSGGEGMGEVEKTEGEAGKTFTIAFVSGASSGMLAALLTNPFDVLKTRRQALSSSSASPSASTLELIRDIHRTEGFAGMMKGITPRIAKVAPACGIMIGMFEAVEMILGDKR